MSTDLHNSSHLCALAQELAEVANRYQSKQHEHLQIKMYSNYSDDQDEIYVVSEDANTGKKWQVVRVALAKLSEEVRASLNLQIEMYNQSLTTPIAG